MKKDVLAYLHSHWDREWYKTFEEYRLRLCDVLDDIFHKIDNGEINSFYLDGQTIALDDYLEIFPQKKDYVISLIKNKKLFIGPFYDLADEFLVNGECLFRNLLIGIKEAKNFGEDYFLGYLPDAFGHNSWMPMILNMSNLDKALVWRGVNHSEQEFCWCSPDGSGIKTAFLQGGYYQDFFAQKSYKKNVSNLLKRLSQYTKNDLPILLPVGADHLACEDNIKAKFKNFNRDNQDYKIKLSSLKEYFEKTKNNKNLLKITGELRDNSNSCILPSVYSARIYLKQENMKNMWLLTKIAEPLYSIFQSKSLLKSKKENFAYAYKTLIKNHAHDSICGCCVDEAHRENMIRYEKVNQVINTLISDAKYNIAKNISKKEIGVINLSNYDFSGVFSFYSDKKLNLPIISKKKMFPLEISQDIHNIPIQENYKYYYEYLMKADIKGLSFKAIMPEIKEKSTLKITNKSLENEFLHIEINKDGTINIKNKLTGKTFKNLFKITDEADVGDSYTFSCIKDDKPIIAKYLGSKITENNQLRNILRLNYSLNIPSHAKNDTVRSKKTIKHEFFVDLTLCENSKRLDINIEYENFSKDHILKLNFALPKSIENVIAEDTFGTIKRSYKPDYDYKKLMPLEEFKELNLNTAPLQRFVSSQGLCVLTKGLQEYEVYKNNLNITLLRSFGIISKRRLSTRTFAAGPPIPTPEGQCLGKQKGEISLLISDDTTEMMKEADFFYNPLLVIDGKADKTKIKDFSFLDLNDDFYLYSLKGAEESKGFVAKIFNTSNQKNNLVISEFDWVFETDNLEEYTYSENLANKKIVFQPNELKILYLKA